MIHYSRIIQGLLMFVENELASKLAGSWKAWVLRGLADIAAAKAGTLIKIISGNPIATALGIIDGENVNIDVLLGELRKQAQTGPATIDIPMIGPVTFNSTDVDTLNRYIRG